MSTITYNPATDELIAQFQTLKGKPSKEVGNYKFWWDKEGNILGIEIDSYNEEKNSFKRNARSIRLGNLWKGLEVSEEEIEKAREELLRTLESKL
jgi:hypothetical protein